MKKDSFTEPMTVDPGLTSIGRQPVFDAKDKLWGYELFCVGKPDTKLTMDALSNAYGQLRKYMDSGRKVIVDFSERGILENLPYALPPALGVVKLTERTSQKAGVLETLEALKADGYIIFVDGFSGDPVFSKLYQLAGVLGVESGQTGLEMLSATAAAARRYNASLVAMWVPDQNRLKLCRDMGFSLFHGPFFKAPDLIAVRKLSSNEVLRFNLLRLVETDDPDLTSLAQGILADVTISFRLLSYLNSAAFGFSRKVNSINHAIALLGWRSVRNWLRVILLSDMGQSKTGHELVMVSAQRGMFMELVAREHDFWGFEPAKLNLVGTFSLLDALLGMPMTEVVEHLPLDHKTKAALCREPQNEYLPLLHLVQCLEEARWEDAEKLTQQLNLDRERVRASFQTAIEWTSQLETASAATV
jgi:EAL and modified HD-GYP domain-containing signal transduction protein